MGLQSTTSLQWSVGHSFPTQRAKQNLSCSDHRPRTDRTLFPDELPETWLEDFFVLVEGGCVARFRVLRIASYDVVAIADVGDDIHPAKNVRI